eukprot:COSAG05_NODE_6388_length_969_cov_1.177011_1_plen_114_part_01
MADQAIATGTLSQRLDPMRPVTVTVFSQKQANASQGRMASVRTQAAAKIADEDIAPPKPPRPPGGRMVQALRQGTGGELAAATSPADTLPSPVRPRRPKRGRTLHVRGVQAGPD